MTHRWVIFVCLFVCEQYSLAQTFAHSATLTTDALPDFNSAKWNKMFGDSTYQYPFDEDDLESMTMPTEPNETANAQ